MADVPIAARCIVVTFGASHAVDLIAQTLTNSNDSVLIDDPVYLVLHAQLRAHSAHLVLVPRIAEGT